MSFSPYVWLGGLLILILACGSSYVSGRHDGVKITAAKYEAQQIVSDRSAADALARAAQSAKDIEHASQTAQEAASATYQKELTNVTKIKDRVIAQLRAGSIRLRDPGAKYSLGANTLPSIGTTPGGCNGGAEAELSDSLAEFLTGEASRADGVVAQLQACQAVVKSDRGEIPANALH